MRSSLTERNGESLSDQPMTSWLEDFPHEEISREAFDEAWGTSREYLSHKDAVGSVGDHQPTSLRWIVGAIIAVVAVAGIAFLLRRRRGRTG